MQPVVHSITWWQNGLIKFDVGTRVDGLVVMMLFVVTLISLLVHIYSVAYMREEVRFTALLLDAQPLHRVDAAARRRRQHARDARGLGRRRSLLVRADRALLGGATRTPTAALKAFLTTRTGDIGLDDRDHHHVLRRGHVQHHRHERVRAEQGRRPLAPARRRDLPVHRDHRQERSVPAPHLAPRRHGRPHAGVRAHPRRDDGRRRRVPRCAPLPGLLRGLLDRAPAA